MKNVKNLRAPEKRRCQDLCGKIATGVVRYSTAPRSMPSVTAGAPPPPSRVRAGGRIRSSRGGGGSGAVRWRGWEGFFPGAVNGKMTGEWMCRAPEWILSHMWS